MKKLRSGYTTGACAAAAAKGAAELLLQGEGRTGVEIPFPGGRRVSFDLVETRVDEADQAAAYAAVIKDAGDDPDVTNGAVIAARVSHNPDDGPHVNQVTIVGGEGVGVATKPGLAVAVGEPAINPVPLQMITEAVLEVVQNHNSVKNCPKLLVEVIVPKGRELARQTLNERLGIIGGISILGTTGIVRPISAEAWTATITASMDVAVAGGHTEIVLSTGRTSEAALEATGRFAPEALVMMGDYLEFALKEAGRYPFTRLHMAGMWAKILKAALHIPQTHVRFGALEIENAVNLISDLAGEDCLTYLTGANTAREIYERLRQKGADHLIHSVCQEARAYHRKVSGLPVTVYLVEHTGRISVIAE